MVPQGMGSECSAIRQYGRSTDRAIGIAWKAIGWLATADRDRGLPPSWMPNQSGLWRPFEAGRHLTVWRSTRQASAMIFPRKYRQQAREFKAFAARVGRLGTHAVSYAAAARCNPGARNQTWEVP